MAFVLLNIGSNLGNRRLNLSRAVNGIAGLFGDIEISHAVESDPWGFDSTNRFLNIGVALHTDMDPAALLYELQALEKRLGSGPHRDAAGGYADRTVDIDIVAIDRMAMDTPALQIPHPRLAARRFFLEPLDELAPGWTHPATGMTARQMLDAL